MDRPDKCSGARFPAYLASAAALFAVIALSFILMRLAPGARLTRSARSIRKSLRNLRHIYRLDLPLWRQFLAYLQSLARGDFGPSLHWRDFSVNELFAHALPISMRLGAEAMIAALVIGGALGIAGATGRRARAQRSAASQSMPRPCRRSCLPPFVIAPLLQLFFGLSLHALPVGGWNDGAWKNQILPAATLALPQIAIIARLMQAALRDVLAEPHIRTLRAFGLPAAPHHRTRAARGDPAGFLLSRARRRQCADRLRRRRDDLRHSRHRPLFRRWRARPRLSRWSWRTVVVVATLVIVFNLLVDLAYAWLDPRIADAHGR